jgi:hypothetical protein
LGHVRLMAFLVLRGVVMCPKASSLRSVRKAPIGHRHVAVGPRSLWARRLPPKKIVQDEFPFAGRKRSAARLAPYLAINGLRTRFGPDGLIKCVAVWATNGPGPEHESARPAVLGASSRGAIRYDLDRRPCSRARMHGRKQFAFDRLGSGAQNAALPLPRARVPHATPRVRRAF